jgi:hypothetical protein
MRPRKIGMPHTLGMTRIESDLQEVLLLDQLWEEHMLTRRSIKAIKEAAKNGCFRSMIELDHFKRDEGKEEKKAKKS